MRPRRDRPRSPRSLVGGITARGVVRAPVGADVDRPVAVRGEQLGQHEIQLQTVHVPGRRLDRRVTTRGVGLRLRVQNVMRLRAGPGRS